MTTDTVSLVMIVRNGERFLPDALASVRAQTRSPDEIVVVDGGSTDHSVAVAESHGVRVTQQPGRGIGDARNHGMDETSGSLIAFLDCDDIWLPTKLDCQVRAMVEHPDARYSLTLLDTVTDDEAVVHPNSRPVLERGPVLGWTPSALLARRSLFDDVGRFDTELGVGVDMDFFARLIDADVPNANVDEVLVHKRIHDRNESVDVASNTRDMLRVARRSIERRSGR